MSGLFFANAKVLVRDIEDHQKHDTKAVIIDAGAIGSIDITGADSIESLYRSLKQKGEKLYKQSTLQSSTSNSGSWA